MQVAPAEMGLFMRQILGLLAVFALIGVTVAGCSSKKSSDPFAGKGSPYYAKSGPLPKGGGRYLVGKPYEVAGRWFTPREQPDYDKAGVASWYGPQFHRRMTSNGEWFDMNDLTAAHATLPLPSYVKVTNLENGRTIVVRVNDRGPFVGTRIIDLSRKTAEVLDFKGKGMAKVRVKYLGPAPLNDNGSHLLAMNRNLRGGTPLRQFAAAPRKPKMEVAAKIVSPPPAKQAGGDYFIQVGSFANPDNAERARNAVASAGPVEVVPLEGSSGTLYRVRVGPLVDESEARNALQTVVVAGHTDARLVMAHGMM